MKKIGLIILGVILLGAILVLTLVMEILEFFMGAISFVVVAVVLIILYNKIKERFLKRNCPFGAGMQRFRVAS